MRHMRSIAAAIFATILLAGCTASPDAPSAEKPAASLTPISSASPSPAPEAAKADGSRTKPLPLATTTTVDATSIWDFTLHDVQTDANAWVAQADAYNEAPGAGNTWVGGYLSVVVRDIPETAATTDPVSPGASLNPVFVGASGTVYDFWTNGFPATFEGKTWNSLPDVFITPGTSWDQAYAMQVPTTDVAGGTFAVRHEVSGKVIFFQ